MNKMKTRYRLTSRGIRGGMFYCVDKITGKRISLQTTNKDEAQQIIEAKNNSVRQPVLNLQITKAYPAGTDNGIAKRLLCPVGATGSSKTKEAACSGNDAVGKRARGRKIIHVRADHVGRRLQDVAARPAQDEV